MPSIKSSVTALPSRIARLRPLFDRLEPVPESWLGEVRKAKKNGKVAGSNMDCMPCFDYKALVNAWRRALRWTEGLDNALAVMLSSVASTKMVGDQLWVKVLGPASCGKSTLCEALCVNKRYVIGKSTIRGFHSGWKGRGEDGGEDYSLIEEIRNKTLVTKDGDTLLQSPNLGQILAEGRDIYDSVSRSHYRHGAGKDYQGIRTTWILAGTGSLRYLDSSELGQRFLDCVVMEEIDNELEDEILWRVANRVHRNMSVEADGKPETQYEPELAEAMMRTGGYVDYLRQNASELLSQVHAPEWALRKCTRLGKFVAFMRARPSQKQNETKEREFAPRLVSQHTRLAECLTIVFNKREIDADIMKRTRKVALDTARGQTLKMADMLYEKRLHENDGMEARTIAMKIGETEDKTRELLRFLRHIKALEYVPQKKIAGITPSVLKYQMTDYMQRLYEEVMVSAS